MYASPYYIPREGGVLSAGLYPARTTLDGSRVGLVLGTHFFFSKKTEYLRQAPPKTSVGLVLGFACFTGARTVQILTRCGGGVMLEWLMLTYADVC